MRYPPAHRHRRSAITENQGPADSLVLGRHSRCTATTSLLFATGKWLFGLYLGHSTIGAGYGAAGSLVIVVLWTYYSSLILLFGAVVRQVQARLAGEVIVPTKQAVHVTEHTRIQAGRPHHESVEQSLADEKVTLNALSEPGENSP